jgi:hypothetical protein
MDVSDSHQIVTPAAASYGEGDHRDDHGRNRGMSCHYDELPYRARAGLQYANRANAAHVDRIVVQGDSKGVQELSRLDHGRSVNPGETDVQSKADSLLVQVIMTMSSSTGSYPALSHRQVTRRAPGWEESRSTEVSSSGQPYGYKRI